MQPRNRQNYTELRLRFIYFIGENLAVLPTITVNIGAISSNFTPEDETNAVVATGSSCLF